METLVASFHVSVSTLQPYSAGARGIARRAMRPDSPSRRPGALRAFGPGQRIYLAADYLVNRPGHGHA
jgi:hypothetical protein